MFILAFRFFLGALKQLFRLHDFLHGTKSVHSSSTVFSWDLEAFIVSLNIFHGTWKGFILTPNILLDTWKRSFWLLLFFLRVESVHICS